MEPQEPRLINVLGMLWGETQQQMQLQKRAGLSREPAECTHRPLPLPLCWYQAPTGSWLGLGQSANLPLSPGFTSIPAWWAWSQCWRSKSGGTQPAWQENTSLFKIITILISFILLAKATAYNNIWPWKLNYFQPRSLWERWWLHPSPVSRLEKCSPKDSQPILSFSFPFNHSKTLSQSFSYANLSSSPGFPFLSWYFISLRKLKHKQVKNPKNLKQKPANKQQNKPFLQSFKTGWWGINSCC